MLEEQSWVLPTSDQQDTVPCVLCCHGAVGSAISHPHCARETFLLQPHARPVLFLQSGAPAARDVAH